MWYETDINKNTQFAWICWSEIQIGIMSLSLKSTNMSWKIIIRNFYGTNFFIHMNEA